MTGVQTRRPCTTHVFPPTGSALAVRGIAPTITWALDARVPGRDRDNIGRADFVALGEAAGVRPRAVERALDELWARVDLRIDGIDELPFDGGMLRKLRRAVEYRRERLR